MYVPFKVNFIHSVYALVFTELVFHGFWHLLTFAFLVRIQGRPCFTIAQEPDPNFHGYKLSQRLPIGTYCILLGMSRSFDA